MPNPNMSKNYITEIFNFEVLVGTLTMRVVNNIQCTLAMLVSSSRELSLLYDKYNSFAPINSVKTQFNKIQT